MDEAQFLTLAREIIQQHNCEIVNIDLENCILEVEGPEERQLDCALQLGRLIESIEEAQKEEEKAQQEAAEQASGSWC